MNNRKRIGLKWSILFTSILGLGVLGSGLMQNALFEDIRKVGQLFDGVQTCYQRVSQTYTAKIMKTKNSDYLTDEFGQTTESCFSDVLVYADETFHKDYKETLTKLNELSNLVHGLHKLALGGTLLAEIGGTVRMGNAAPQLSQVSIRFQKIENLKDLIVSHLFLQKSELQKKNFYLKIAFYVGLAGVFLGLLGIYRKRKVQMKAQQVYEDEALELLSQTHFTINSKIDGLVTKLCDYFEMPTCAKLFSEYHGRVLKVMAAQDKKATQAPPYAEGFYPQGAYFAESAPQGTLVDTIFNQVLSRTKNEFFKKGILFDLDIDDKARVYENEEELAQVIYNLIMNAMDYVSLNNLVRKIVVKSRVIGKTMVIEICNNGPSLGFFKGVTAEGKNAIIKVSTDQRNLVNVELLKDLKGTIKESNLIGDNGIYEGLKVQLVMPLAGALDVPANNKVVTVMKGSKRQIQSALQASL